MSIQTSDFDLFASRARWLVKSTDYTTVAGVSILADTSSATFTITLPASPAIGDQINIGDAQNTWATNNLTVDGNGNNIDLNSGNLICNVSAEISLVFAAGTMGWTVYGQ